MGLGFHCFIDPTFRVTKRVTKRHATWSKQGSILSCLLGGSGVVTVVEKRMENLGENSNATPGWDLPQKTKSSAGSLGPLALPYTDHPVLLKM